METVGKELNVMANAAEVVIFHPNSRRAHLTITSLIPEQVFAAAAKKLSPKDARVIEKGYKALEEAGMEHGQMRLGDRRVRIKTMH